MGMYRSKNNNNNTNQSGYQFPYDVVKIDTLANRDSISVPGNKSYTLEHDGFLTGYTVGESNGNAYVDIKVYVKSNSESNINCLICADVTRKDSYATISPIFLRAGTVVTVYTNKFESGPSAYIYLFLNRIDTNE